jgi:hypothetical protein
MTYSDDDTSIKLLKKDISNLCHLDTIMMHFFLKE